MQIEKHRKIVSVKMAPSPLPEDSISATQHYMDVKNGRRQLKYIHDDLKEYLKDTYGVIVYQEQVMAILVGICGYTLEETDIIR